MAKTNFSGPITTGPIQVNTGTTVGTNVRDAAFVKNSMSFPFDFNSIAVTTDPNKLGTTTANPIGTEVVTLVDATQNVPGITAVGGFEMACFITITTSGSDTGKVAAVEGTDILGNSQTENITLASGGVVSSVKSWKTVTAITYDAVTLGTTEWGVLTTGAVSVLARSLFNENPLAQDSDTVGKNLANNIVIPPFSRITDIRQNNTVVYSENMFIQIGANVAQAAGATLNSHDLDYFAGSSTADLKAVASHHIPVYWVQTTAQMKNCLNVSDDDASGYELDKALILTGHTDDILTTGEATLSVEWLQKVNATN